MPMANEELKNIFFRLYDREKCAIGLFERGGLYELQLKDPTGEEEYRFRADEVDKLLAELAKRTPPDGNNPRMNKKRLSLMVRIVNKYVPRPEGLGN